MFHALNAEWVQILNLVAVVLLPVLVAVVTKEVASRRVKSVTLTILAAALAVLTSVLDDGGYTTFNIIQLFVQNVVFAVGAYYGVLKPTGLAGAGSAPSRAVPGFIG